MAKKKANKFRTVYGILVALYTVFIGALFVKQTWSIYRSAPQSPYTVANISAHFQEIAIPVWVWLAALALNILLAAFAPKEEKRPKAKVAGSVQLARVQKHLPTEEPFANECALVGRRKRGRRIAVGIFGGLLITAAMLASLAVMLGYFYYPLFKSAFFTQQHSVVGRLVESGALALGGLLVGCIVAAIFAGSRKSEQKAYLAIIARSKQPKEETPIEEPTVAEGVELATVVEAEEVREVVAEPQEELPKLSTEERTKRWKKVLESLVKAMSVGGEKSREEISKEIRLLAGVPVEEPKKKKVAKPAKEKKPNKQKVKKVKAPKVKKVKTVKPLAPKKEKKQHPKAKKAGVCILRISLALIAVGLIALGVINGGMKDVLAKAINICTQCIGLG